MTKPAPLEVRREANQAAALATDMAALLWGGLFLLLATFAHAQTFEEITQEIEAGYFETVTERIAEGCWHQGHGHELDWDCCPDHLWPHPAGCCRIYQYPHWGENGWWCWQWQVRESDGKIVGTIHNRERVGWYSPKCYCGHGEPNQ